MFESARQKLQGLISLRKRSETSFGKKIQNKIEIHYHGPPFDFMYNGSIDEITVEQFKTEQNLSDIQIDEHQYQMVGKDGQPIQVPEDESIKENIDIGKIRFYKLFSKKTTEVNYLATYDLDLIAVSRQVPFTQTSSGQSSISRFRMVLITSLVVTLSALVDSYVISSYNPYNFSSPTPVSPVTTISRTVSSASFVDFYIPVIIGFAAVIMLYIQHNKDLAKTMVHEMSLEALPFKIINANSILPVAITNSSIVSLWDYQSKLMKINPQQASKVVEVLQEFKADQLENAFVNNKINEKNIALMKIENEQRALNNADLSIYNEGDKRKRWVDIATGSLISGMIAAVVIIFLLLL